MTKFGKGWGEECYQAGAIAALERLRERFKNLEWSYLMLREIAEEIDDEIARIKEGK